MRRDHLRNEAAYLPESVEDLAELRRRIIAAGHAQQTASGIVGWLVAKAAGDPDPTSAPTRSAYRKILAELQPATPGPRRHLEPVPLEPAARRRRLPGGRALSSAVVALALLVGGAGHRDGSQARTGDLSDLSNAENPRSRRRSVKSLRKAA